MVAANNSNDPSLIKEEPPAEEGPLSPLGTAREPMSLDDAVTILVPNANAAAEAPLIDARAFEIDDHCVQAAYKHDWAAHRKGFHKFRVRVPYASGEGGELEWFDGEVAAANC